MKLFKKSIALFAAALLFTLSFCSISITADAAEPVTYYLKYVAANSEWRYQVGTWESDNSGRELYYMEKEIKDGDVVVIDSPTNITLKLNVRLSNLTLVNTDTAVVHAKGYDYVYVLSGAKCAINGDVTNADVYGNAVVNFNNNVGFLRLLHETSPKIKATVSCIGTVDHVYAGSPTTLLFENYSYAENSLRIVNGSNKSDTTKFTTTPPAATTTPAAPATGNADEYDDVPKTGDYRVNPLWLVCIAAVCGLGAYKLKEAK